ncbi:histone-lysine n-methyltransferase setmar-like protein [Elysia marginata]|uniref:Histone-lysine n-methyltransferase setmar-like protein n=1 Tax=Elysia marginata TaxID=1093978 RepID=A0AAV4FBJ4_9GAST|nr:histone-lysine n-methyltransferase setmar-like protein [Elysia marginata]
MRIEQMVPVAFKLYLDELRWWREYSSQLGFWNTWASGGPGSSKLRNPSTPPWRSVQKGQSGTFTSYTVAEVVTENSQYIMPTQDEQRESSVSFSRNLLRRFQTEQNDFLGRIITGDETWVYSWDPETKRQSAEWRDFDKPRPEKVRRKQGALKNMHMVFFYMNGVILRWPVPIGTTIRAQYYKKISELNILSSSDYFTENRATI